MKRLLLLLVAGLMALSMQAQTMTVTLDVWNNSTFGVPNYPVWITVSGGGTVQQFTGLTNSSGYYMDSLAHPGTGSVTFLTYDCNGNMLIGSKSFTPNNTWVGDTFNLPCQATVRSCMAFMDLQNTPAGVVVAIDSSMYINAAGSMATQIWQWGDGSQDTTQGFGNMVTHTYASNGTYYVQMSIYQYDTLNNTLCYGTYGDTVVVGSGNPGNFCNASYWVDTLSSGGANAYIVNSSTPAYNNPNYTTSYSWDFGDGTTSVQPFPVHTYTNPGTYGVCLTITSVDGGGNTCTSTFCDTLGIDSSGNLLYKSTTGFTLHVLDPATVGVNEVAVDRADIYPNPATDVITADLGPNAGGKVNWIIYDVKGAAVLNGSQDLQAGKATLDVKILSPGVYILSLDGSGRVINQRLMIE